MPLGPQPKRARGTVERPYSALGLRLVLAVFGLVVCAVAAAVLFAFDLPAFGWAAVVLALVAIPDIAVVTTRMRRARQAPPPG